MKQTLKVGALILTIVLYGCSANSQEADKKKSKSQENVFQTGDIIFQSSFSGQSKAVSLATHSKYTHCGIIVVKNGKNHVLEAVQPVKITPIDEWISHGDDGHYLVKRLIQADEALNDSIIEIMLNEGSKHKGKNYDLTFEWSDDRMYCSELVWKLYQRSTGLEVGELAKLSSFDLSHPVVKEKLNERYGDKIPMDEIVISPQAIVDSELLKTVFDNY